MEPYQWDAISPVRRDRMLDAENAVEAVTTAARESFFGWLRIGAGLVAMQQAVMELSGSSTPKGKAYNAAFKVVAARVPRLAKIETASRSHAVWMYENREAVEAWHAGLDDDTKWRINHPRSVHRRFERDQREAKEAEEAEQRRRQPPPEPRQPPQDTPSDPPADDTPEAEQPRPGVPHAALDQTGEVRRGSRPIPENPELARLLAETEEIEARTQAAHREARHALWVSQMHLNQITEFVAGFGIAGDDLNRLFELIHVRETDIIVEAPKDWAAVLVNHIGIDPAERAARRLQTAIQTEKDRIAPGIKRAAQAEVEDMTESERETTRVELLDLITTPIEERVAKKARALALGIEAAEEWPD